MGVKIRKFNEWVRVGGAHVDSLVVEQSRFSAGEKEKVKMAAAELEF